MKFIYKGRPRVVTVTVQAGDELEVSHYRTIRVLGQRSDFEEAPVKKAKAPAKKAES